MLIPTAERFGVPLEAFLSSLERLDRRDDRFAERHRELSRDTKRIRESLARLGAFDPSSPSLAPQKPSPPENVAEEPARAIGNETPGASPFSDEPFEAHLRLPKVIRKLRRIETDARAALLLKELRAWDRLPKPERHRVLLRAEDEAEVLLRQHFTELLRNVAASTYPRNPGCLTSFVVMALGSSAIVWWPPARSWLGPIVVLGSLFAALSALIIVRRRRIRRWLRHTLVQQAEQRGVDFQILAELVGGNATTSDDVDSSEAGDPKLRIAARVLEANRHKSRPS
jgi:hypothetical protein